MFEGVHPFPSTDPGVLPTHLHAAGCPVLQPGISWMLVLGQLKLA
jgi:hypothetical protein